MTAINRVLIPIDLSLNYQTLSPTTRRMFDRRTTEIVMLNALEEPARSVRGMEVARSMAQLDFLAWQEFKLAPVAHHVERGRAADCILRYAQSHDVDVIVMQAGDRWGHVAEEVLTQASCAVWIEPINGSTEDVRNICCAINPESLLSRASEVATEIGAQLRVIQAIDGMRIDRLREEFALTAGKREGSRLEWVVFQAQSYPYNAGASVNSHGRTLAATA